MKSHEIVKRPNDIVVVLNGSLKEELVPEFFSDFINCLMIPHDVVFNFFCVDEVESLWVDVINSVNSLSSLVTRDCSRIHLNDNVSIKGNSSFLSNQYDGLLMSQKSRLEHNKRDDLNFNNILKYIFSWNLSRKEKCFPESYNTILVPELSLDFDHFAYLKVEMESFSFIASVNFNESEVESSHLLNGDKGLKELLVELMDDVREHMSLLDSLIDAGSVERPKVIKQEYVSDLFIENCGERIPIKDALTLSTRLKFGDNLFNLSVYVPKDLTIGTMFVKRLDA